LNSTVLCLFSFLRFRGAPWLVVMNNYHIFLVFGFFFVICMLCWLKYFIIPITSLSQTLNWLVSLICRTLDVIYRLFSRVPAYTQSITRYINFPISILCPFSDMNTHIHSHNTCLHICELVRFSDVWRRRQKRERKEGRDREWR